MEAMVSDNPYTLRFSNYERLKFTNAAKDQGFPNLADFIREACNILAIKPDLRHPIQDSPSDLHEALKRYELYDDRQTQEKEKLLQVVSMNHNRIEIIEKKINLLLEKSKVSKVKIQEV